MSRKFGLFLDAGRVFYDIVLQKITAYSSTWQVGVSLLEGEEIERTTAISSLTPFVKKRTISSHIPM